MTKTGLITESDEILRFFEKSKSFGSLFILTGGEDSLRYVCEIKNINDGQGEISFIPIGDEEVLLDTNMVIEGINEANNASFKTVIKANHGKKWLTLDLPEEMRLVNLRQFERLVIAQKVLGVDPVLSSYGEEGIKKLMSFKGDLIDMSSNGASFEITTSRLDGFFKGDHIELKASEKFSFLSRVKGVVVHKTIFENGTADSRCYRIGIKFKSHIDLSPVSQ